MILSSEHKRIYGMFVARLNEKCPISAPREFRIDSWKRLVFGHGCRMVFEDEVVDLVNHGPGDNILVESINVTAAGKSWILVPKSFAEKILVLGGLP